MINDIKNNHKLKIFVFLQYQLHPLELKSYSRTVSLVALIPGRLRRCSLFVLFPKGFLPIGLSTRTPRVKKKQITQHLNCPCSVLG